MVLLLLRLLLLVAAILALRRTLVVAASIATAISTSATRVLKSAFTVLLVDEEPAVLTVVPDGAPWGRDLRCALASAVALLTTVTLLGTAVAALRLVVVVSSVAALVVATLLATATTLALVGELVDQVAE
jgi:hypothetical protein